MRYVEFAGLTPKRKPESLSTAFAQVAENLDLYRGELLPLRAPKATAPAVDTSGQPMTVTPRSLLHIEGITIGWPEFTWSARDPRSTPGDTAFIYVSGGSLWWQSLDRLLKKSPPVKMGVCRPSTAPQATALAGAGCPQLSLDLPCVPGTGDCPEIPPDPRAYVYCWVRDYPDCQGRNEQSPPSPPAFIDALDQDAVVLSTPTPPLGVTRVFWYRWVAGSKGQAAALFVGESDAGESFVDTTCPGDLGHELPSSRWFEPPCDIVGVAPAGDTSIVVWSGKRLWMSEPRLPHAFDQDIGLRVLDHRIVGVVGQIQRREQSITYELHIATTAHPYLGMGALPEKLEIRKINEDAPCVSRESITDMTAGRTGWASTFGFVSTTGDRVVSETDAFFTDNEWQQLQPEQASAFYFNERVWISTPVESIVLGIPSEGGQRPRTLSTMSLRPVAAAPRVGHPPLVAMEGPTVFEWLRGEPMRFRWRSEEAVFAGLTMMAAAKVVARRAELPRSLDAARAKLDLWMQRNQNRDPTIYVAGDCELRQHATALLASMCARVRLWREGQPGQWITVGFDRPFRLPRTNRALRWSIEVEAAFPVIEVHYNTAIADLALEGGNQ